MSAHENQHPSVFQFWVWFTSDHALLLLIRLGAFFCFAGWTWVHFYWEGPYGVLLWQNDTYALAGRLGISWDQFVGSGADDGLIQKWLARVAWLYLVCTILTVTVRRGARLQMTGLILGSVLLCTLSYAKYIAAQSQPPMFIEHGGQMLMPIILVLALTHGVRHRITVLIAMTAFLMTFAGHGSYALGIWPTPPNFYAMTSVILNFEYDAATLFLRTVGVLDFVVCVGIFIPLLRTASAFYAAAWGFFTALARPVAGMSWDLYYYGADQYLHEMILRSPHWVIPLYLFLLWRSTKTLSSKAPHRDFPQQNSQRAEARQPAPVAE